MKRLVSGLVSVAMLLSLSCTALAAGPSGAAVATDEQVAAAVQVIR